MEMKQLTLRKTVSIYANGKDNKLTCWNAICITAKYLGVNVCAQTEDDTWVITDASEGEWELKECGEKSFMLETPPLDLDDTTFLTELLQELCDAGMQRKPMIFVSVAADPK